MPEHFAAQRRKLAWGSARKALVVKVLRLSWAQKGLLLETTAVLALGLVAGLWLPSRWVARVLGKQQAETPLQEQGGNIQQIRRLCAMLHRVSSHVPWTTKCLDQAVAGKIMLARRGIPATVYF